MASLLPINPKSVTVHIKRSKIPPSTSVHFTTGVRWSRVVRLSWSSRSFMQAATSKIWASNSSGVLLVPSVCHCVYSCMFCVLLFHFISYVFLLLYLCILIIMYALFCIFCFHHANWHSSATLTEVFLWFSLSCKANARI